MSCRITLVVRTCMLTMQMIIINYSLAFTFSSAITLVICLITWLISAPLINQSNILIIYSNDGQHLILRPLCYPKIITDSITDQELCDYFWVSESVCCPCKYAVWSIIRLVIHFHYFKCAKSRKRTHHVTITYLCELKRRFVIFHVSIMR